jgi:hypothetical protein
MLPQRLWTQELRGDTLALRWQYGFGESKPQ